MADEQKPVLDEVNDGAVKVASNWKSWLIGLGLVAVAILGGFILFRILF